MDSSELRMKAFLPPVKELWIQKWNIIRSSIIGTIIGIIPATGGNIASFIAYDQAKRFSKSQSNLEREIMRVLLHLKLQIMVFVVVP